MLLRFVESLLDWQRALAGFFSFTALYEIAEPQGAATAVGQYFREGSEKGSSFCGMWHLIATLLPLPPSTHAHKLGCAAFIMSAKSVAVTQDSPLEGEGWVRVSWEIPSTFWGFFC